MLDVGGIIVHLVKGDGGGLPERWVTRGRDCFRKETFSGTRGGKHVRATEGGGRDDKDEAHGGIVIDEVDGPAELTGENQGNDEVNIARLTCLKDPYQFFLETEFLNLLTLFFAVLVAVILNLYG